MSSSKCHRCGAPDAGTLTYRRPDMAQETTVADICAECLGDIQRLIHSHA